MQSPCNTCAKWKGCERRNCLEWNKWFREVWGRIQKAAEEVKLLHDNDGNNRCL